MRVSRLRFLTTLLCAIVVFLAGACAQSPTGRSQVILKSKNEMDRMGDEAFSQIKAQNRLSRDPDAIRIIRCVSFMILSSLEDPNDRHGWEVLVFDGTQVNAFALPGRNIGVYEGIFRVARNPDQLAAVIGHEIGHVTARHANERVSTALVTQTGVNIAQAAAGASGGASGQMVGLLGAGATMGVILPFNRKQESEADIIGMDLMAGAGFDPGQTIPLWENMGRTQSNAPPEFLSTHPSSETRMNDLKEHLPEAMTIYESARAAGRRPDCQF